jgi:hypothetical protein
VPPLLNRRNAMKGISTLRRVAGGASSHSARVTGIPGVVPGGR